MPHSHGQGASIADYSIIEAGFVTVDLNLRRRLLHSAVDTAVLTEVFLRVRLADGTVGWAETRGNGAYATKHDTTDIVAALMAIPDLPWSNPGELADRLAGSCPPAAMLVDVAWRDAVARSSGVPLWSTLTSTPPPVAIPTHTMIVFGTVAEAEEHTSAAVAAGYPRLKIRIGGDPGLDRRRVEAARNVAGDNVTLVVDANGGWDVPTAIGSLRWLTDLGVAWFEQPVAGLDGLAAVRSASPIPVWADESVRDAASVRAAATLGAIDGVHLKLEKTGTVAALTEAVDTARRHELEIGLGQMDCGRLGCATTVQLAAGLGIGIAELWGCANVTDDRASGIELADGAIPVPIAPGLGVDVELSAADLNALGRSGDTSTI
ncbi:mandelate racemase/muconate lactonizing enzyme family protein [Saccharopolyspora spinosa]|nr:enolase C-terminal domain-like protein [Saccharopolyspora spinosa]